jgi:hypothetical protein
LVSRPRACITAWVRLRVLTILRTGTGASLARVGVIKSLGFDAVLDIEMRFDVLTRQVSLAALCV